MIESNKIHFKTYAKFKEALDAGLIRDNAVVFIKDTHQIYTHGEYYDGNKGSGGIPTHGVGTGTNSEIFNDERNLATGEYSHAEGNLCFAIGEISHAEGYYSSAEGEISHAEGRECYAEGEASHAEGRGCITKGRASHAEGTRCFAIGESSHAEGNGCYAEGMASHVEGYYSRATSTAYYAHAEGLNTVAENQCEHAQGMYNKSHRDYNGIGTRFSHGIGMDIDNRKNALEIMSNGDIYFGTYGVDPKAFDATTKKLTMDVMPAEIATTANMTLSANQSSIWGGGGKTYSNIVFNIRTDSFFKQ